MTGDWNEVMDFARGERVVVERVRVERRGVVLEGRFELPPLAELSFEEQTFIIAFIRSHGSIKEMEKLFGISYPTVKNRLNGLSSKLEFVEINPPPSSSEVLDRLENGEIGIEEALGELGGKS